jgi:Ran-binding protein 3
MMASETPKIDEPTSEPQPVEHMDDDAPTNGSSDGDMDGEGAERTAREKLKKTSIAGLSQHTQTMSSAQEPDHPLSESTTSDALPTENGVARGRPSKKRSFEDLQSDDHLGPTENGAIGEPDAKRNNHKRMRSREISHGNAVAEMAKESTGRASPVQEESDDEGPGGAGVLVDPETETDVNAQKTVEDKILEEEDTTNEATVGVGADTGLPSTSVQQPQESEKVTGSSSLKATSGFSNSATTSPFGITKSSPSQSEQPPVSEATSNSAFASSGLASFASSEKSPFGAGAASTGGFGSGKSSGFGSAASGFGGAKPSGFGSTSGFGVASPFGSRPGGFGSSGGFGSAAPKPFGAPSTTFASSSSTQWGKVKPFGSKDEEEDEEGDEGEGDAQQEKEEDVKPDSRFHEQVCTFTLVLLSTHLLIYRSRDRRRRRRNNLHLPRQTLPL